VKNRPKPNRKWNSTTVTALQITLTDHPDLTLSLFHSLHSDRGSEPIITVCKMADVIRRMVLHIAIFGYMQDGYLTDPKPNPKPKPNPNP